MYEPSSVAPHWLLGRLTWESIPMAHEPIVLWTFLAVVAGGPRDYCEYHPTGAVLVVEIADATLAYDRTIKAAVYARAGIAEYWIVNLRDRLVEVHRQPTPMSHQPLGYHLRSVTRHTETERIVPLAASRAPVVVADLLP